MTIAIAGASGFVGRALIERLRRDHRIIALSRSARQQTEDADGVEWRQCDLFNLKQAEDGLRGADVAIYLVHSMLPAAKLTQGSFSDLDLLIADNFGRAACSAGIKRIIYLGGIIPDEELSPHLASRHEVESALGGHGVQCISLRAGLIIGRNGSSFDIMRKLVERLPIMVCPGWTRTRSQPVSLRDVVETISRLIDRPDISSGSYDLGGRDVITYIGMMERLAQLVGCRRIFIPIFLFSPNLSRLWVTLVTGAPRELIGPLVQSLRHEMVARNTDLMTELGIEPQGFDECLAEALSSGSNTMVKTDSARVLPPRSSGPQPSLNTVNSVCSVQRLPLIHGIDVAFITAEYARWLWNFFSPWIVVRQNDDGSLEFVFRFLSERLRWTLLYLSYAPERSSSERQMFYISGGLLLNKSFDPKGRFEFREVLGGKSALVAIFDYVPALPWWLYKNTQAIVHLIVMKLFKRHLVQLYKKDQSLARV